MIISFILTHLTTIMSKALSSQDERLPPPSSSIILYVTLKLAITILHSYQTDKM